MVDRKKRLSFGSNSAFCESCSEEISGKNKKIQEKKHCQRMNQLSGRKRGLREIFEEDVDCPTVKSRCITLNRTFLWELDVSTLKHHYALDKPMRASLVSAPLKLSMEIDFFEKLNDDLMNDNDGKSDGDDDNSVSSDDTDNETQFSDESRTEGNKKNKKDKCKHEIRLSLTVSHESNIINKIGSFDYSVCYYNDNENTWQEMVGKQAHCAAKSQWGFSLADSMKNIDDLTDKNENIHLKFQVEFITKSQTKV